MKSRRERPAPRGMVGRAMTMLLQNGWICTMDDSGRASFRTAGCSSATGSSRRSADGAPPAADERSSTSRGAVVTPGLVNTHHHLYQTLTRARAQEATLFEWLRELYPVWARIDAESEYAAARTGLAELALSGCTTVFDHHYVFPRGRTGLWEAEVQAAGELGRADRRLARLDGSRRVATAACRPDSLVEPIDDVLADTERLAGLQDADGMVQLAVAPCSPVLGDEGADGRSRRRSRGGSGCSLHTHLAETVEEDEYCLRAVRLPAGRVPRASSGWIAGDVWCAHCVHLSAADVAAFGARRRRGRALPDLEPPARRRRRAGARARSTRARRSGSASTARPRTSAPTSSSRSSRRCSSRAGAAGPTAMTVREALRLGDSRRRGGARPRRHRRSSRPASEPTSRSGARTASSSAGAEDPVAGLVLSAPHRVDRLYVGGEEVVRDGHLVRADEDEIAREHRVQARRLRP